MQYNITVSSPFSLNVEGCHRAHISRSGGRLVRVDRRVSARDIGISRGAEAGATDEAIGVASKKSPSASGSCGDSV